MSTLRDLTLAADMIEFHAPNSPTAESVRRARNELASLRRGHDQRVHDLALRFYERRLATADRSIRASAELCEPVRDWALDTLTMQVEAWREAKHFYAAGRVTAEED